MMNRDNFEEELFSITERREIYNVQNLQKNFKFDSRASLFIMLEVWTFFFIKSPDLKCFEIRNDVRTYVCLNYYNQIIPTQYIFQCRRNRFCYSLILTTSNIPYLYPSIHLFYLYPTWVFPLFFNNLSSSSSFSSGKYIKFHPLFFFPSGKCIKFHVFYFQQCLMLIFYIDYYFSSTSTLPQFFMREI